MPRVSPTDKRHGDAESEKKLCAFVPLAVDTSNYSRYIWHAYKFST